MKNFFASVFLIDVKGNFLSNSIHAINNAKTQINSLWKNISINRMEISQNAMNIFWNALIFKFFNIFKRIIFLHKNLSNDLAEIVGLFTRGFLIPNKMTLFLTLFLKLPLF